jgi:hypothetical protein
MLCNMILSYSEIVRSDDELLLGNGAPTKQMQWRGMDIYLIWDTSTATNMAELFEDKAISMMIY